MRNTGREAIRSTCVQLLCQQGRVYPSYDTKLDEEHCTYLILTFLKASINTIRIRNRTIYGESATARVDSVNGLIN